MKNIFKSGNLNFTFIIILIISLSLFSGCSSSSSSSSSRSDIPIDPTIEVRDVLNAAIGNSLINSIIVLNDTDGRFNATVEYHANDMFSFREDESYEKKQFEDSLVKYVSQIFSRTDKISNLRLIALKEDSHKLIANSAGALHLISFDNKSIIRDIGGISINKKDYDNYLEIYEDPQVKVLTKIEYYPFFLIESKLKYNKMPIKNVFVDLNETQEKATALIYFEPNNVQDLGNKGGLNKEMFQDLLVDMTKIAFQSSDKMDKISIIAKSADVDTRSNQLSSIDPKIIITLDIPRKEFEEIYYKWDDLKYQIYEDIKYTPIYRLDFESTSNIEELTISKGIATVKGNLDYYEGIDKSVSTIESDAVNIIYSLLGSDPKITKVIVSIDGKIPSEETDEVNKNIYNFISVSATRTQAYTQIDKDNLNNKQIISNLNAKWAEEALEFYLVEQLSTKEITIRYRLPGNNIIDNPVQVGAKNKYITNIDFDSAQKSATVSVNTCLFGSSIEEGDMVDDMEGLTYLLMYILHPPYLDEITYNLDRYSIDDTGKQTVTDFGSITFAKDEDMGWWYNEDGAIPSSGIIESIDEYLYEDEDDLDFDSSLNLCIKG